MRLISSLCKRLHGCLYFLAVEGINISKALLCRKQYKRNSYPNNLGVLFCLFLYKGRKSPLASFLNHYINKRFGTHRVRKETHTCNRIWGCCCHSWWGSSTLCREELKAMMPPLATVELGQWGRCGRPWWGWVDPPFTGKNLRALWPPLGR